MKEQCLKKAVIYLHGGKTVPNTSQTLITNGPCESKFLFLYLRGTDLISIYPMTNKMSITTGSHFDVVQYTSAKHSLKSLLS